MLKPKEARNMYLYTRNKLNDNLIDLYIKDIIAEIRLNSNKGYNICHFREDDKEKLLKIQKRLEDLGYITTIFHTNWLIIGW